MTSSLAKGKWGPGTAFSILRVPAEDRTTAFVSRIFGQGRRSGQTCKFLLSLITTQIPCVPACKRPRQILGTMWSHPLGWGRSWHHRNTPSPCVTMPSLAVFCVTYVRKSRSFEVTAADTERLATNDFLLAITGIHLYGAPISYRFPDKFQFPSKIANLSHRVNLTSP